MTPTADVCSYGGGVQSTALLVLAATGRFDCDTFVFANVGDDSEHPETLAYIEQVALPYAEANNIDFVEVHKTSRTGERQTIWTDLEKPRRSLPIPVRIFPSGAPAGRPCTNHFKIEQINKLLKARGATEDAPATMALGISVDELERAKPGIDPQSPFRELVYPLLDLGLRRVPDCHDLITDAGLPVPRKSACWFCPYTNAAGWRDLRSRYPELWDKAVTLEADVNERRADADKNPLYFSRKLTPLDRAIDDQMQFPGLEDDCDSGYCFV